METIRTKCLIIFLGEKKRELFLNMSYAGIGKVKFGYLGGGGGGGVE